MFNQIPILISLWLTKTCPIFGFLTNFSGKSPKNHGFQIHQDHQWSLKTFRQPGDSALGVGGGGSAPTPPKCRPKGLRNVGLWASPGLRLMIAVGR